MNIALANRYKIPKYFTAVECMQKVDTYFNLVQCHTLSNESHQRADNSNC